MWKPPSESKFNEWLGPSEWLAVSHLQSQYRSQKWMLDRLKSGLAIGVARTLKVYKETELKAFVAVPMALWEQWDDTGDKHFWETGDAEFVDTHTPHYARLGKHRFFDVRFDPSSFNDNQRVKFDEQLASTSGSVDGERKPISGAELERIAKALVAGWGTSLTEEQAVEMAKGMFPRNLLPRDPFLAQYRVIRGAKKRGRQPLADK